MDFTVANDLCMGGETMSPFVIPLFIYKTYLLVTVLSARILIRSIQFIFLMETHCID